MINIPMNEIIRVISVTASANADGWRLLSHHEGNLLIFAHYIDDGLLIIIIILWFRVSFNPIHTSVLLISPIFFVIIIPLK